MHPDVEDALRAGPAQQRHVEHGEELREDRDDVDAHVGQRIGTVPLRRPRCTFNP